MQSDNNNRIVSLFKKAGKWLLKASLILGPFLLIAVIGIILVTAVVGGGATGSEECSDSNNTNPGTENIAAGNTVSGNEQKNAQYLYDFLIKKGGTSAGVCGAMGVMEFESHFNPNAINPTSGATGLAQWLGPRLVALNQFASQQGKSPHDFDLQVDFLWKELNSTHKVAESVLVEKDIDQAVKDWLVKFEGVLLTDKANAYIPQRTQMAHSLYSQFAAKDPVMQGSLKAATNTGTSTNDNSESTGNDSPDGCNTNDEDSESDGTSRAKGDDYPAKWRDAPQDSKVDDWGYYNRECVSFVAWRLHEYGADPAKFSHLGNGNQWAAGAAANGVLVDHHATVHSVAEFEPGSQLPNHVAWVTAVHNGTIDVEEYNWGHGHYHTDHYPISGVSHFIHFDLKHNDDDDDSDSGSHHHKKSDKSDSSDNASSTPGNHERGY